MVIGRVQKTPGRGTSVTMSPLLSKERSRKPCLIAQIATYHQRDLARGKLLGRLRRNGARTTRRQSSGEGA
jgi:hypothetical protein